MKEDRIYGKITIKGILAYLKVRTNKPPDGGGEIKTTKLTSQMMTKMVNRCDIWSRIVARKGKRITLITLTLTGRQKHDDKEVKRAMLGRMVLRLKREGYNYLWKAEKQRNGNIHFHILIDGYMDKDDVRREWLRILISQGYPGEMHNINKLPCTDIRATDGKEIQYLLKYVSKDTQEIQGRAVGMSSDIKKMNYPEIVFVSKEEVSVRREMQQKQWVTRNISEKARELISKVIEVFVIGR